jgi:hypothetical protein
MEVELLPKCRNIHVKLHGVKNPRLQSIYSRSKRKPMQNAKGTQWNVTVLHWSKYVPSYLLRIPRRCNIPSHIVLSLSTPGYWRLYIVTWGCAYLLGEWLWHIYEISFVTARYNDRRLVRWPATSLVIGRLFSLHSTYGATAPSGPWPSSEGTSILLCLLLVFSILLFLRSVMCPSERRPPILFLVFPLVLYYEIFHQEQFLGSFHRFFKLNGIDIVGGIFNSQFLGRMRKWEREMERDVLLNDAASCND